MIDHITVRVSDLEVSKQFYMKALAPLGYGVIMEVPHGVGLGVKGKPDFWLLQTKPPHDPTHIAFASHDRAGVDAFHAAAIKAGARDNGQPGPRPEYHPGYYGAFVLDPDGYNIEAVCHTPA